MGCITSSLWIFFHCGEQRGSQQKSFEPVSGQSFFPPHSFLQSPSRLNSISSSLTFHFGQHQVYRYSLLRIGIANIDLQVTGRNYRYSISALLWFLIWISLTISRARHFFFFFLSLSSYLRILTQ